MKMIKYLLLLAAVAVAVPAVAQITNEVGLQRANSLESLEHLNIVHEDVLPTFQPQAINAAPVQTGELNNYEYRVEATDPNFKGKYKGLIAETVNEDKGYALVMRILPDGAVHKFCAGNEEVCKSISNGVECGDTWPAWCYLPKDSFVDKPVVDVKRAEKKVYYDQAR